MPQRIISLDVTGSDLKAAVIETTFRDYRVAGFYHEGLSAADGTTEDQICRFIQQHFEAGDTVLSALPGDRVSWRTLFLPFRDQKRLAQTIPFEVESNVPFGLDEVVIDYQILRRDRSGTTVLAALVPKQDLEQHLALLQRAGADPKIVDLGPLTTLNMLTLVPDLPPTFAFVDFGPRVTTVALRREGELVGLRTLARETAWILLSGNGDAESQNTSPHGSIEALLAELRWTFLALNGAPLEEQFPCYVAGDPAIIDAVQDDLAATLPVEVRRLDQLQLRNLGANACVEAPAFSSTLGLALREVTPANAWGVNFRRGEFTFHRSQQELRRALRGVAALAALVVALTVADLYMEYRQLATRAAAIDTQIQKVVSATLPDVHHVSNPSSQLQAEIDSLKERVTLLNGVVPVSSSTSVDILRTVSMAVPTKIRIDSDDYIMDPDAVRLRGNTDTFESVDAIKQKLIDTGFFRDVSVKDAKAGKGGKGVDFRMTLLLPTDFRPRAQQP